MMIFPISIYSTINVWGSIAEKLGKNYWIYGVLTLLCGIPVFFLAFDSSKPEESSLYASMAPAFSDGPMIEIINPWLGLHNNDVMLYPSCRPRCVSCQPLGKGNPPAVPGDYCEGSYAVVMFLAYGRQTGAAIQKVPLFTVPAGQPEG